MGSTMIRNYFLVFIGGGIGAMGRYWLSGYVYKWLPTTFPYGNLVVNISACFLIGLVMSAMQERFAIQPELRLFLTIGILGGYSTFSSFSYETLALLQSGEVVPAIVNISISLGGGLVAAVLGLITGSLI